MKYRNPIISGFHPDPSVCRVGKDFYLVNSTFEYFPGIPVYHSTDLVNWEQVGHCLGKNFQHDLCKGAPNRLGIFAPTIRYNKGRFYCIVTNVCGNGNFFVYTDDIYGKWSEPVNLPFGGIDPSLFFDDDGRVYYSGTEETVFICEIDIEIGNAIGEKQCVWNGTGGNNPEGPHIYKKDGWYYLMIAEGGTELCHTVTIARSRELFGTYEECPHNPILTNRGTELPIKAIGHADMFDDADGNWWAVCLGIRPVSYPFRHILGRETMLVPVKWEDNWPVMGNNGRVEEEFERNIMPYEKTPDNGGYFVNSDVSDDFSGNELHPSWNFIYNPVDSLIELCEKGLILYGNEISINEDNDKAIVCRRQEHIDFTAETTLIFNPEEGDEAGLTVYLNNMHHYEAAVTCIEGEKCVIIRRQIGKLKAVENMIPISGNTVMLRLDGSKEEYAFSFSTDGIDFIHLGSGEVGYLSTEAGGCFTGNYIGLYSSGNGKKMTKPVIFRSFSYKSE